MERRNILFFFWLIVCKQMGRFILWRYPLHIISSLKHFSEPQIQTNLFCTTNPPQSGMRQNPKRSVVQLGQICATRPSLSQPDSVYTCWKAHVSHCTRLDNCLTDCFLRCCSLHCASPALQISPLGIIFCQSSQPAVTVRSDSLLRD